MTPDRRLTPATDRIALESLRGEIERPAYTSGRPVRVRVPVVDLLTAPDGRRDRQVTYGADLTLIDSAGEMAFVQNMADGHCGWLPAETLSDDLPEITHRLTALASHIYPAPDLKRHETCGLSLGARLSVVATEGRYVRLASGGYVPIQHVGTGPAEDPVAICEQMLGVPYLWGGNSCWGIDCSGLVQLALHCCGIACPSDSDLQRAAFPKIDTIQRGDLLFWPGHVAMAVSPERMIHATAWQMAVIHEEIDHAISRIDAAGEGPFLGAHRPC